MDTQNIRKDIVEISDNGFRVLVVDDDITCIKILTKMLADCQYEVTVSRRAQEALSMLREDKNRFDIVLTDLHMPDMDGLKLLEIVGLEMGLPVVMMSSDDREAVIIRGIIHGACDYLVKPVRKEAIKYLWQHVIRKKSNDLKEIGELGSVDDFVVKLIKQSHNYAENVTERNKESTKCSKRRKDDDGCGGEASVEAYREKKQRFHWTMELNDKFVTAVTQLGHDKAVPKKILELMQEMNVGGITRENIASHLQKYRLYIQKHNDSPQEAEQNTIEKSVYEQASLLEAGCNLKHSGKTTRTSILEQCSLGGHPQFCVTSSPPSFFQYCPTIPPPGGLEWQNADFSLGKPIFYQRNFYDTSIPKSNSYPITHKIGFPLSRTNSGERVFANKHTFSGEHERPNANYVLGLPLGDLTNHFGTRMPVSSFYRGNELSKLALPHRRTDTGESVFGKFVSSGGIERLDSFSKLLSPPVDHINPLDPKLPGSSSYPVNELSTIGLPLWRTNSGESSLWRTNSGDAIFGKGVPTGGLGSNFDELSNQFAPPLHCSRTNSIESVANKNVPSLGNTSSSEECINMNLGNIGEQSTNLSIADTNYMLNFDQSDMLCGPFK